MRARVDVHGAGAHDELGGLVELRGVEQLLRFGQSGLVEPLHAFHHLRRGGGDIEGKVDVHVAPVARLGRQTDEFDFEVFESLEAEFFLQKRCTLATETLAHAANSLMESPRTFSPMARAEMPSCCSVGVRPCASEILRLISMRTPTLAKPAKKGQVYFGTFRPVSGSVRDGAAAVRGREKKCRVWRARFCPSRAWAILGLSTRDAKETLIPRALPGRACDSSPRLSILAI